MLTVLYYASAGIIFVTVCGSVVNSGLWLGKQQNYTDKIVVGALVHGLGVDEPICTPLVTPLANIS